ncbi:MAG: hypothetical protein WC712_08025 [Candidatus Brocadiia bacterium]
MKPSRSVGPLLAIGIAFFAMLTVAAEGEEIGVPYEPSILGRISFSVERSSPPGLNEPPEHLVFLQSAEKSIAILSVGDYRASIGIFSLPDGIEIAKRPMHSGGLLSGRHEIGLYTYDLEDRERGSLSVLRNVAERGSLGSEKERIPMPGGLTAGPPWYTIYTGGKWWVLYGEADIYIIDRMTLEYFTLPALYGADSRIAISDDVATQMKLSRTRQETFLCPFDVQAEQASYTLLSTEGRTWRKLPYDPDDKESNLTLWVPFEGHLVGSSRSDRGVTSRNLVYVLTKEGEYKWLFTSSATASVKFFGERNLLMFRSLIYHNYWGQDMHYYGTAEYLDMTDKVKSVASGREEYKQGEFRAWTVAAGLGKRIDNLLTLSGSQLSLIDGGATRQIKAEGLAKCDSYCAVDGRLYAWSWTFKEKSSECNLTILKLDDGFFPGVEPCLMDYVR